MLVLACLYLCSASSWQGKTQGDLEKTLEGCKCMNPVDFFQLLGFIESEIGMGHAKKSHPGAVVAMLRTIVRYKMEVVVHALSPAVLVSGNGWLPESPG